MNIFQDLSVLCNYTEDAEIALHYQSEPEKRDIYISKIYCKYFKYLLPWYSSKMYYSDSDKESFLLEAIHTSLLTFNPDCKTAYKTLLSTYLRNRIRTEDEYMFAKNRNWYIGTTFASGCIDEGEGQGRQLLDLLAGGKNDDLSFEMSDSIETLSLSENQYRYCQYVMSVNYVPRDAEVARELNISKSGIRVIKSYLKEKLQELL